jgi:hypothetical protein
MERTHMAVLIDRNSAWATEIAEASVSPAYGSKRLAPMVRASANVTLPEDCGVLLLPMPRVSDIGMLSAIDESPVSVVRGYRYQALQTTEFLFFAQGNGPWKCGLWTSDASLLYCKLERGRFAHVIMVSGSFGGWRGKRFVSHPSTTESFEWLSRPGARKVFSSDGNVLEDSVITDFEVFDSVS